MCCRLLLCLTFVFFAGPLQLVDGQDTNTEAAKKLTSSVQGRGNGSVTLKPTLLRVSIPLKVVNEVSWDATEKLRQLRHQIVDRATEMGAIENSIRTVGFHCGDEDSQTVGFAAPLNSGAATPQYAAKCYFVADFKIRELQDNEAMVAMSQSQLEELVTLVPKKEGRRRSYSYTTLTSGLTTQQLESPLALFVATVSDEDRRKAFQQALDDAKQDVQHTLSAMGVDRPTAMAIHRSTTYTSSRTPHPLESALYPVGESVATSLFPDQVAYSVNVNVSATFHVED